MNFAVVEQIKKLKAKQLAKGVLWLILSVALPFFLCRGLIGYFVQTDLKEKQEQEFLEMKRILSRASAKAETVKRYDAAFLNLSELPFMSKGFKKKLQQIYTSSNGAVEFFVLNSKLKSVEFSFSKRPPRSFVEKKFVEAILNPDLADKNAGFIKGVSGYKSTAKKFNNAPNRIIRIGNTKDNQWGGYFLLKDKNKKPAGHLVVLIKKSKINADELLDEAVSAAIRLHGRCYKLCWRSQNEPDLLRPTPNALPKEALRVVDNMPIGHERFFFEGKAGLKMVSDAGSLILALAIRPIEPAPVFKAISFSAALFFALSSVALCCLFLTLSAYKVGIRTKLAYMFLFGAALPLLLLIFTGIADRAEREKVLKEDIHKQSINELTRIDDGMLYEQKNLDKLIAANISSISLSAPKCRLAALWLASAALNDVPFIFDSAYLTPKGFATYAVKRLNSAFNRLRGLASFFLESFEQTKIISESLSGIASIKHNSREAFVSLQHDSDLESLSGFILSTIKKIFLSMRGLNVASAEINNDQDNIGSFMSSSITSMCNSINTLNLFGTALPAYFALLFDSDHVLNSLIIYFFSREALQKNYIYKVSKRHDKHTSLTDTRFAALPKINSSAWRAFPKRITGENPILREMASQVCKTSLPSHREETIGGRKYLLTASQGKYLDGYVLFYAHPYRNIEIKIAALNNRLIFLTALVILLASFSAFVASNMLMKPLNELTGGLKAFSEGNFRITLKNAPVEEFNAMLSSLNQILYNFHELDVAKTVQETLYPEGSLKDDGFEIVGKSFAATELAGDYIDWFRLKDGRILVVIGDVTGHGIAPAMIQASIKVWISLRAEAAPTPADLLKDINALHLKYGFKKLYMTCWLAFFNPLNGRLDFASAGHPYPIILRQNGQIERLNMPGMPIGITKKIRVTNNFKVLNEGDTLILYTDGIVETPNPAGKLLGYDNFEAACGKLYGCAPSEIVYKLMNYAKAWGSQNDDRTLVVLKHLKPEAEK